MNRLSIEEREGPDGLSAQTPVAIINSCSLQGEPDPQSNVTEPIPHRKPRAIPKGLKRPVSANAPVSPSKRRLPVRAAAEMGRRAPGAAKLGRPAYIFGDLNNTKTREPREETSNVPKPAVRMLRSGKATANVTPVKKEAQPLPAEAANLGRQTRSQALTVDGTKAKQNQAANAHGEHPQQHSTDTKGAAREGMPKKAMEGGKVHSEAPEFRTTRSGARQLKNSELMVVIPAPDRSKKPESSLAPKMGTKRPRKGTKPSVELETAEHQASGQGNSHVGLTGGPESSVTKETRLGNRSLKDGSTRRAKVQRGQALGELNEEHDHTDGENPDKESKSAAEMEDEAEETATSSNGSARSEVVVDSVGPEADRHSGDVHSDNDSSGWEGSEPSDAANVADDEDNQDSTTVNGRPIAKVPFGQQASWERVLQSAMTVGQSKRNGVIKSKKPKLKTNAIKALLELSSKLKKLLIQYGDEDSSNRATLQRDIDRKLKKLKAMITEIDEEDAGGKKKELIRDIYAHGIPQLVSLLNEAFLRDFENQSARISGLKPSQQVHDQVLILCQKALNWGAQPSTTRPIKRPTRQSIFPILRDMKIVFEAEQRQTERAEMSKERMLAARLQLEKAQEAERRRHEQYELEKDSFFERQKAALDMEEEQIKMLRRKFTSVEVPQSSSSAAYQYSDTPIERSEIFASRSEGSSHPKRGNRSVRPSHDLNDTAPPWTDEEREWLMIGLQMYQGETLSAKSCTAWLTLWASSDPDRYERIIEDYGQPGEPLQHRSLDDLIQRARGEKSNVEAQHEVPEWLQSV